MSPPRGGEGPTGEGRTPAQGRGGPGLYTPSEAVARLVEGCRRRASLAHLARALCGGLAAALATVALVSAGGRPWGDPEALALGAAVGLLALLGWARSARVSAGEVAGAIDRALPGAGLLAAFEGARRGGGSPVQELAARRAYRAVPRARADAAVVPAAVPFLVLPLGAVAALLLAVQMNDAEAARARARGAALQDLARDLAAAVARHGDDLAPADAETLGDVAEEASAAAAGGPLGAPALQWSERIEEAAESAPPEVAAALQRLALDAELVAPEAGPEAGPETLAGADGPFDPAAPRAEVARAASAGEGVGRAGDAAAIADGASESAAPSEVADGASGPGAGTDGGADGSGTPPGGAEPTGRSDPASGDDGDPAPPRNVDPGEPEGAPAGDAPPRPSPSGTPAPPTTAPARHRALVRAWLASRG